MGLGTTVYVTNREGFRNWLEKNGSSAKEIWLVIFKDASGAETLTYEKAVEEALCFGWTEGQGKPIDDEKHIQRFTPRPPDAPWTDAELERARALVTEGRMNEAGMATLPEDLTAKDAKKG